VIIGSVPYHLVLGTKSLFNTKKLLQLYVAYQLLIF